MDYNFNNQYGFSWNTPPPPPPPPPSPYMASGYSGANSSHVPVPVPGHVPIPGTVPGHVPVPVPVPASVPPPVPAPPPGFNSSTIHPGLRFGGMYPYGINVTYPNATPPNTQFSGNWNYGFNNNNVNRFNLFQNDQQNPQQCDTSKSGESTIVESSNASGLLKSESIGQESKTAISSSSSNVLTDEIAKKVSSLLFNPDLLKTAITSVSNNTNASTSVTSHQDASSELQMKSGIRAESIQLDSQKSVNAPFEVGALNTDDLIDQTVRYKLLIICR